ncbi:T9SS type A sorting domain-containing protein [Bizionia gelidisalsuginis]|uniref:T9SS type A sorting domain-containing protein n=1 Tax=Bizionia gelidisalsuginis TaxID=291188 RepID=A0ABY3MCE4_9FLAO|nr:zinc-dependent metalloprotease family protein [Bizionia gelidisalsuginis]TYC15578.1 T9SS type A sorting domain-containing protein [Bizionia gelidisalsuginis]
MKHNYLRNSLILVAIVLFSLSSFAQQDKGFWNETSQSKTKMKEQVLRKTMPNKAQFYTLNIEALKNELQNAPSRKSTFAPSSVIIDFPTANNTFESFRVKEASVMEKSLQNKYPEIRTYIGESVNYPGTTMRFSITNQGLHTMSMSINNGVEFIDPFTKDGDNYIVYAKRDLPALDSTWICGFENDSEEVEMDSNFDHQSEKNANDGMMREYRLAVATTIEYSAFHWQAAGLTAGDSEASKKAAVLAAVVVTINRNNQIYERDLSLTMTLVANNDDIIFIGNDNFSNDNASLLIAESQTVIDNIIQSANYDIGHTFSTGGGGLASLNSPCTTGKARGITGSPQPVGDAYDIDYVAHEMGHQFGAPHTFNGNGGNCAGNNRSASNAYEPGSGSTIMAYAGICAPQNVQGNSDTYFHQKSLQMIFDNISGGASSTCPNETTTGNSAPTSSAGSDYIIPMSTPYQLVGASTDTDGTSTHTYTWEQYDLGPAGVPTETTATGPLVRSYEGTSNVTRYIPRLQDIVASGGVSTTWEKLSSVQRAMNFRLTVRDNDANGGQTAVDAMMATVTTTAGPFLVTSQNTSTTWSPGNTETITWDVAGTNTGIINEQNVDILLSTDGGLTFTTPLATGVPNSGSYDVLVPDVLAESCRIMIKGSTNIFFNINDVTFGIGYNTTQGNECNTYTFTLNQTITPNATEFEFLDNSVSASGTITDVNVKYDISTTALDDLHMAIISPSGTRSYLYAAGPCGGDGSANIQVTYDDEAAGPIVCGTDPLTGTATPANIATPEPLSLIDGEEMNGVWRFMVANLGSTTMTFNTVELEICKDGMAATLSPERINQEVVSVDLLSSATITTADLKVTSPNTTNVGDIMYTVSELPTKGSVYLNSTVLAVNGTFTQANVDAGDVTYTTTSGVADTDGFRVNMNDGNGGDLPNLLVQIEIVDGLSTDDYTLENNFAIYPNPNNGEFNVKFNATSSNVSLELFDIRGRSVYTQGFNNSGAFNETINVGNVQSGMYLLNVNDGSRTFTKKIIVE